MAWFDELAELVREFILEETRVGYYVATVTNSARTFRRVNAKPEWLDQDGEDLEGILRVANPILDVIYRVGTRVAVLSQDGIPEAGAVIGAVSDDKETPETNTVWIRADLQTAEGHVELGATKSIRIQVAANGGTIVPLADGTVRLEGVVIELGDGATKFVALGPDVESELASIATTLAPMVAAFNAPPAPMSSLGPGSVQPYAAGGVSATKTKAE